MIDVDTSKWPDVGATSNTRYYAIEARILLVAPHPGAIDDATTALENQRFQFDYFDRHGRGVVIILTDRLRSQDKGARRVYQQSDPVKMAGVALLGGSLLGRAIGSFFLGIAKPPVPLQLFGSLDDAIAWARSLVGAKEAQG